MRTAALIVILACCVLRGGIVDRIAATVGPEVITESRVALELRMAALIEGTEPALDLESRRKMVQRLIEQTLIRREVGFTRFPASTDADVELLLAQVAVRYPAGLAGALERYAVSEADLKEQLRWQLTMLRFIEYRFQPAVAVSDAQLRQEYRRQAAVWREKNAGDPPALEQMRPELEKILRQQLTDSALDRWLGEVRTQNTILYRGEYR